MIEAWRARLLRWDRVVVLASLAIPFVVLIVLGFYWLVEKGWLLWFLAVSIGLGALVTLVRMILRWLARRREMRAEAAPATETEGAGVAPDPDWGARERRAFESARRLIETRTKVPVPWPEMQDLGLEVISTVAAQSGPRAREPLDFTLPEALLLLERVSSRLRTDLREMVPFSDTVTLRTGVWIWRNRGAVATVAAAAQGGWRLIRLVKNPPAAILQEIDRAVAGGHSSYLSEEAMAIGQAMLLEEVAKAAVDLYSGRLRFSDAELLELREAEGSRDRARQAQPDAPVRIVLAGQVSVGKSTLINALIGREGAETDVGPTTAADRGYPLEIGGAPCVLIDLPGLDGSRAVEDRVVAELAEADMALWAIRANRPARGVDAAALARLHETFAASPERRPPPVLPVLTAIDTLDPGWPHPEHRLPREVRDRIAAAVAAVAAELSVPMPVPVSAVSPEWNVESLEAAISAHLVEALMVQRNRARLGAGRPSAAENARRGARALGRGLYAAGSRWSRRFVGR